MEFATNLRHLHNLVGSSTTWIVERTKAHLIYELSSLHITGAEQNVAKKTRMACTALKQPDQRI